jgi:glycyl-tRNA synthetase
MDVNMDEIVSLCKRRGFIYAGSDVYGGLAGTWDYGPLGVSLKRNIMGLWWRFFVEEREDIYGVDAAILMNPKTWVASGHVATFSDPLVECGNCHGRFRADKIDMSKPCPTCGKKDWGEVRQFNMMFETNVGPVRDEKSVAYLRPETAQGIFTNYRNVVDSFYPDLPFGVAQIGKAFRNEISPRDFVFRSREFEQMEIEYFVAPEEWEANFEKLLTEIHEFLGLLGLPEGKIHELEVPEKERAHYSKRTVDIEFDFPIGREELLGLAYRTDFDLQNIQKFSGKSMEYIPKGGGARLVPHVIEPSFGVERLIMAVLVSSYVKEESGRVYLNLPAVAAPVKVLVSPLLKNKPELVETARGVYEDLKKAIGGGAVMWDDSGNIGKRYAKADEIGVPYCVVVDFESLEGQDVTVRERNTTEQRRVKISELAGYVQG